MIGGTHARSRLLGGLPIRTLSAAAVAVGLLGLAGPGAAAADTGTPATPSPLLTFVPPSVGPLRVDLGATIIDGQVISPGLHVFSPGITLPPITWTPPSAITTAWPAGFACVYAWCNR